MLTESMLKQLGADSVRAERQKQEASKRAVAKWEKIGLLEGLKSDQQRTTMATLLENQVKSLLTEASSTTDVAGFQAIALPLVRRVFGNLLAQEIVSIQPMSLPSGLVFWLDYTYGTNRAGTGTKDWVGGGSLYGDPVSPLTGGVDYPNDGGHYNLHNSYTQRMASGAVGILSSGAAS